MNIADEIESIGKVQQAEIMLLPPTMAFRIKKNGGLGLYGCNYRTQDASNIAKLIDVLRVANVREARGSETSDESWEPRESVFLGLPDGLGFQFYFTLKYTNRDLVYGSLHRPSSNYKVYIVSDPSIVDNLIRWSSGAEASFGEDSRNRQSCEYFRDAAEHLK